ncbi:uncharacterized protein LOC121865773 [Homarus americanus]|uniref:uncharacterized protein LOC121865773 n=1 Tax=Homarus americanus TaxID=6706 RepID=UPI001C44D3E2|nr:uncharacterized protein LOC121865773 [Homarus americanus]
MEMRSEATGLFLCMNKRGKLYASCNRSSECEFVSQLEDTYYDTLQSRRFSGRYLAIATSGRIKRARRVSGPLGKENFFLFRRIQLQEAQRIIERYHERLVGQPPQRCDGYNEYNKTTAGSASERGQGEATVVTLAPTVVPMGRTTTTTTTSSPPASRRCRIVKGKKRCKWCRIVKGKKKCRKRPKKCKNKKCRKRKKQRKSKRRRKHGREKDSHEVNTNNTVDTEAPRRRKVSVSAGTGKAQPRQRHEADGKRKHTQYTSITVAPQTRRPHGRRIRHQRRLPTSPSLPMATPTPSRAASRVPRGPLRPTPMTVTPQSQQPFPPAPSSARPYRVRHAHDARRRRRWPRGHLNPPTSADA